MFVLRSSFEKVEKERDSWRNEFVKLQREWNILVNRINAMPVPFDDAELKKLLMLCHPDKHGGKQMAVEMTAKINSLRKA